MAVAKPEVLVSQLVGKIATRFQRLPHVFGVQQPEGAIGNTPDVTGSWKLKVAVAKPEILISQLVD
jgi:hypothetical protein